MVVLATGMGLTSAPATEAIMGLVPKARAGVGSAVSDATRPFGGTLGVAVIGSVYASLYADLGYCDELAIRGMILVSLKDPVDIFRFSPRGSIFGRAEASHVHRRSKTHFANASPSVSWPLWLSRRKYSSIPRAGRVSTTSANSLKLARCSRISVDWGA
ncbi:MAG: hypothetical protein ABSG43_07280 [Solirubrobacteraceae bacterium]|jgi:hypothetical protein